MDIKPIETAYKGYRFRSRLEARWAVFFRLRAATGNRWWEYEAAKREAEHLSGREADVYRRRIADELGI